MTLNNEQGFFISRYTKNNVNPVHEIDVPHWQNGEEIDDNMFVGNYEHIRIYTIPEWYFEANNLKQKISFEVFNHMVNLPVPSSWSELASKYPIGKVLKIKDKYFEVVGVNVEIVTEAFKNGSWNNTDLYTAEVEIKPCGDTGSLTPYEIELQPNFEVMKRWSTSK